MDRIFRRAVMDEIDRFIYEQFNPTAIRYFTEHYGIDEYKVVGLNGMKKDRRYIYPWDV